jgi:Nucleoside-diphosphate-sugar epimerases
METAGKMRFDIAEEARSCAGVDVDWTKLDNRTILISGSTGLVGKYMIMSLLERNRIYGVNTHIIAMGRNKNKFYRRFADCSGIESVEFLEHDVQIPLSYEGSIDYILHMASNTHPRLYASKPIETELANILGTMHLLELASTKPGCRFVFTSSTDIYGDNRSGKAFLEETDCGYIDCNTLRAGYIEGKRASEALCNAYREEKGVDFVIARFCRLYGPTMQRPDSRAISQFIDKAVRRENIVLTSRGTQTFSHLYVSDAVTALLRIMTCGETGNAYNVADRDQVPALRELAQKLADIAGTKVVFDLPDELTSKGASSFQDVRLDPSKLYALGWRPAVTLDEGLRHTVEYFSAEA